MKRPTPKWTVWHDDAGRIVRAAYCLPAERAANGRAGCECIEAAREPDPARQYVAAGELVDRPAMALTVSGLDISGLPDPCDLVIEGATYPVTGGSVTLEFGLPGSYTVTVKAWPWQDWTTEVIAP